MLCSVCKKNIAVVFSSKIVDGKSTLEGLCYNCAKEKGINPFEVLSKQVQMSEDDMQNMSSQFGEIFDDISKNLNIEMQNVDSQDAVPGNENMNSIFSSMLGANQNVNEGNSTDERKKVKVEKKQVVKKKRILDVYGTNLTVKAKERKA